MKVNARAVSFATLIQFSGAVPGKTSSLNLAPAQPSMAGRPMPLEAPLRKRGSGPRAIPGGICAFGVTDEGELSRGVFCYFNSVQRRRPWQNLFSQSGPGPAIHGWASDAARSSASKTRQRTPSEIGRAHV